MKFKNISILPISFQLVLMFIMIFLAIFPSIISSRFLNKTFNQVLVDSRRVEIKSQALILADKISSSSYLINDDVDRSIEAQIDTIADVFDGRIVIIDSAFNIIKDTFNISLGKKSIAEEVIRTFQGENIDKYSNKKDYIIQTFPIYRLGDSSIIDGIMIISSSTEDFDRMSLSAGEKVLIFNIILSTIFIIISILITTILVKPFKEISNGLTKVAEGNLAYDLQENTYILTNQISKTINATLSKLRLINQSRDEFVSNVSHELKTPITSIRVLADSLLAMGEVPNELYKEFMNDISEEIDRESQIIDDLLTLVKLDRADAKLVTEKVNINELVNGILKRLRPIAAKRNIGLSFESMREVEAEVDETKLSLAISNLVENAIKYNKDEGYVKVNLDADHKFFYIKVIDNGVGIPEDSQELVFDRFYRVDKARSKETGGTGLGLAITKRFILKHGGIIRLNSTWGEGTTFTVRIPLIQKKALVGNNVKN